MLGLLPWEKWLPPYVFGPLMVIIAVVISIHPPHHVWWERVLIVPGGLYGAGGTWVWFRHGRNIFDLSGGRRNRSTNGD